MIETLQEQFKRVELMASGDPTWDLSENDCEALRAVLHEFKEASDKMLCNAQG